MADELNPVLADGVRYALLARLHPFLRHDVLGVLQPLALFSQILAAQLRAGDLAKALDSAGKISELVTTAKPGLLSSFSWISAEGEKSSIEDSVGACISLVRSDFAIRGVAIETRVLSTARLSDRMVKELFLAALFALTDEMPSSITVSVSTEESRDSLQIVLEAVEGNVEGHRSRIARPISWGDVDNLARAAGCRVSQGRLSAAITISKIALE